MTNGRYQPIDLFEELTKEVGGLFRGIGDVVATAPTRETGRWAPAVDIREEKDKFVVSVDIPGINPKEVDVTFENGVLLVSGEKVRSKENEGEEVSYYRSERKYGSFVRKFSLPDSVNDNKITATGKDGVLTITLPKREKVKPKKIEVS